MLSSKRIESHRQMCTIVVLVWLMVMFEMTTGQITFSKDWRAGGKRSSMSSNAILNSHGVSVLDIPCDQLAGYSTAKIRDLVRKEAVALLQCETNIGKTDPIISEQDK